MKTYSKGALFVIWTLALIFCIVTWAFFAKIVFAQSTYEENIGERVYTGSYSELIILTPGLHAGDKALYRYDLDLDLYDSQPHESPQTPQEIEPYGYIR